MCMPVCLYMYLCTLPVHVGLHARVFVHVCMYVCLCIYARLCMCYGHTYKSINPLLSVYKFEFCEYVDLFHITIPFSNYTD